MDIFFEILNTIKQQLPVSKRDKCFVVLELVNQENNPDYSLNVHIYEKEKIPLRKKLEHLPPYQLIRPNDPICSETCTICQDSFNYGIYKRELPCKHTFHKRCIDKWLDTNMSCPLCKQSFS